MLSSLCPIALAAMLAWGLWMKAKNKFTLPASLWWPDAEDPALAMELADSPAGVERILGEPGTETGNSNRAAAIALQKFDFVFIALYVMFFAVAAFRFALPWRAVVICASLLTGIFDVFEDLQIIRLARGVPDSSAKRFGRPKWLFYFLTVGLEGALLLPHGSQPLASWLALWLAGAVSLLTAVLGISGAFQGSFERIASAAKLSGFALVGLALAPLLNHVGFPLTTLAEYAVLFRVPLLTGIIVIMLPVLAFFTPARGLLKGLFDVTPLSMLAVTLAAAAVGGTVSNNARIIYLHAHQRIAGLNPTSSDLFRHTWLLVTLCVSVPVIAAAMIFSIRQTRGAAGLVLAAVLGLGGSLYLQALASRLLFVAPWNQFAANWMIDSRLFNGYVMRGPSDPLPDHLRAIGGFLLALAIYSVLGLYGHWSLGKRHTVPALCSALMVIMLLCWSLSAVAFFFDAWRIPILLIVGLVGMLTAQSSKSDHLYQLRPRKNRPGSAPTPAETAATVPSGRIVLVAANGGGIQAAAWTAQVLQGLTKEQYGERFVRSLRMISSVSGGSVGAACFLYALAEPGMAKDPAESAAQSSLDEVAWGLGWTDFLRSLFPWICGSLIGRGRALETAWCLNSAKDKKQGSRMDLPLSDWNPRVASGELPAVIMNATISETGERLLLATTRMTLEHTRGRARIDAAALHRVNGEELDVAVVTAARLSATFPYVTPASRSNAPGPQPHIVDGGYYDNYGMSTLVEWLDEALADTAIAKSQVKSVLVLQIHGAPVQTDQREGRHAKNRGWFYQAIAPLVTLTAVRSAGQIAHNDIELELLQKKWFETGVPIHSVTFEFSDPNAPLSWHLTPRQQAAIANIWLNEAAPKLNGITPKVDEKLKKSKTQVAEFLAGSDSLDCGCPKCRITASSR
ncbi:MAG TPA: patatin-like phospholipase family protein [Bryobacteraceae bacterium]